IDVGINVPSSCLSQRGVTVTCQQLSQAAQTALQDSDAGLPASSLSCQSSGGGCSCRASLSSPVLSTDTYSTSSGGTLLYGSDSEGSDYCVQGNKLYLRSHNAMAMDMGSGSASFNLEALAVLEKQ